ncbi:MAG: hypothetical protein IPG87_00730 [Saprospiraceae bacterium]|nr:hypothetical protein [Candidatus Vicinibacter affinis]MBK7800052.1 hypothetical protein [Candidatus Vicinibacter affinis]
MKRVYSRGEEVQFVSKANIDLYQEVTNKIISMLDSGVAPWRSPGILMVWLETMFLVIYIEASIIF